jgi:tetratricopeptide (TPR) repeat protein
MKPHAITAHNLGIALLELTRWDAAADAFQKAVELQPESKEAKTHLALALAEGGHHDAAIRMLDEVTEQRTTDGFALATQAHALRLAKRLPEATIVAGTAVRWAPALPDAHCVRGWVAFEAGAARAALESFAQALRLAPADLDAELGQAAALSALGDHQAAVESFARALAKSPDWPDDYPELRRYLETSTRATIEKPDAEHEG